MEDERFLRIWTFILVLILVVVVFSLWQWYPWGLFTTQDPLLLEIMLYN